MKFRIAPLLACCPLIGLAAAQTTQTYPDTTGEISPGVGTFPHLDITSVVATVNAAATDITFRINLAGSPLDSPNGTNWGNYMVAIRSGAGGATAGNGWARPINFASGMTHWIGTWVNSGGDTCGGGTSTYAAPNWNATSGPTVTKDSTGITITETVANLALDPGEVFSFDVYSSGGGGADSAVDALSASAASIAGWAGPYTTNAVGSGTNPALQFTMPGTLTFAAWITGFGLAVADQDPGDNPDADGLTNQQEFDANLGLNPNLNDTDSDGLLDNLEDGTMVYNGPSDPGTFPAIADSDGDSYLDGDEVNGTSSLGFVSDPTVRNYQNMTVAGNFPANTGDHWAANGSGINTDMTRTADVDLTGQFGWTLDYHITALGAKKYKLVGDHNWNNSWGVGGISGTDIDFTFVASGIHRWSFSSKTAIYSLARVTFPDVASYLAAYGLSSGADEDLDGINNENEFTKNTDPENSDTDGDGLDDLADTSDPLVPAARDIVFSVNMNVQAALGNFTPGVDAVVVDFFDGTAGPLPDLALSDGNSDGIWTGTLTGFTGAVGAPFGTYKFKTDHAGAPFGGYEVNIANRTFNLADLQGAGTTETLATVFFDNNSTMPAGYDAWAGPSGYNLAPNDSRTDDPDNDGFSNLQEFLFGTVPNANTGSLVTTTPGTGSIVLTWLQRTTGATYSLVENTDLGTWLPSAIVPAAAGDQTGVPAGYTRMQATAPTSPDPKKFLRVKGEE